MNCVKIDRKTRLKLKKKLSIILNFNIPPIFDSSPARMQFVRSREIYTGCALYPYHPNGSVNNIILRPVSTSNRYLTVELRRSGTFFTPSCFHLYVTTGNHVFHLLKEQPDANFYISKKMLYIFTHKCLLKITFDRNGRTDAYDINKRMLFVVYYKKSNRLTIYTNIDSFNIDEIIKVIDEMIFHSLTF